MKPIFYFMATILFILGYTDNKNYVCHLKNYVYIFHSRASGFYTPLKNFITLFVERNKATKVNDNEGRYRY